MTDAPEQLDEPRCARCGCTRRQHHKLHCEGRGGECMCSSGWADPGTPLTALDQVFQAENAEYDAAQAEATTPAQADLPSETRVVVVKPGDVLVFGRVGEMLDAEPGALDDLLEPLKTMLGLKQVLMFVGDIDLAAIRQGDGP